MHSNPEPRFSQVYLDWDAIPPVIRVDCLVEVWKICADPSFSIISHTTDGKLVTSPLQPFDGTPLEFLGELDEALGPDPAPDPEQEAMPSPLLSELDRYLVFSALLRSAFTTLSELQAPASALDDADRARHTFLGDDIDHTSRAQILASLNLLVTDARGERAALLATLQSEPQPTLKARCQAEFDRFDRELEPALLHADHLSRSAPEPPRRRPASTPRR